MTHALLFAASALVLSMAAAQAEQKTVYRCGQTYQDSPCPGGTQIDVADERSDAQRQAAQESARSEADFGSRLQQDRVERERGQRLAGASNLGARPKPPAHAEPEHKFKPHKKKKETTVRATLKPFKPPAVRRAAGT